jgi:hypothetical protein
MNLFGTWPSLKGNSRKPHGELHMDNSRANRMYKILLDGYPDANWADWFSQASFNRSDDGTTLLTVCIPDQPALMGLLIKLNNLGLEFIQITRD